MLWGFDIRALEGAKPGLEGVKPGLEGVKQGLEDVKQGLVPPGDSSP
jgi:hypothetical protein